MAIKATVMEYNKYTYETQKINLDGVVNARQMGDYVMQDGRKIRDNVLLRGGFLQNATDSDIRRLSEDFHVAFVFDFRTKGEVDHAPDRLVPGSQYLWLPTIDEKTEKLGEGCLPREAYRNLENYLLEHAGDQSVKDTARTMYPSYVRNEYTQLQYAAFLQKIIDTPEGAFYWHCSQGKDRTGLGAAYLLSALGADREMILRDFAITNECYKDLIDRMKSHIESLGGGEEEKRVIQTFIGVDIDYFNDALEVIEHEYGGMQKFLRNELCLSDDDILTLQNRLLV